MSISLLVRCIRIFDTQRIERIPRILIVHTQPNPLCHNLLLPLHDRTSAMFRKPAIHLHRLRINVRKERRGILFGIDVHIAIPKARRSSHLGDIAIHDNGGHTIARFEIQSGTISIAMGHVSIGRLVVRPSSKVLNAHEILLSILSNIEWQHVIDIIVHPSRKSGDEISFLFLVPVDFDARLFGLSRFGQFAPPASVGHGGIVQ
mmetsp:Transcript_13172/g.27963  ORF Transcript_13172/g.27963 Transcript_13172/m.27963 type:complete len:204 (+) Transcript_13172:228-839(+)